MPSASPSMKYAISMGSAHVVAHSSFRLSGPTRTDKGAASSSESSSRRVSVSSNSSTESNASSSSSASSSSESLSWDEEIRRAEEVERNSMNNLLPSDDQETESETE